MKYLTTTSYQLVLYLLLAFCSVSTHAQDTGYQRVLISEYGPPEVLHFVRESKLPEPAAGEVRIKVLAVTASFFDTMVRKGLLPIDEEPPFSPGTTLVGTIDQTGPGVSEWQPGQRVAVMQFTGCYSEFVISPVSQLVAADETLDAAEQVSLLDAYVTAYQMLHRVAKVKPGQTILIHGASGAVGSALSELGRVAGLKMYGTASAKKHGFVSELGVIPIDYRTEDFVGRISQLTGGKGVDAVFDAIGVDNFKRSFQVLAPEGRLIMYGMYTASLNSATKESWGVVREYLITLWLNFKWNLFPNGGRSSSFYTIGDFLEENPEWYVEDISTLFNMLKDGRIKPHIWRLMPLSEAAQAHRFIEEHAVTGRIVLKTDAY